MSERDVCTYHLGHGRHGWTRVSARYGGLGHKRVLVWAGYRKRRVVTWSTFEGQPEEVTYNVEIEFSLQGKVTGVRFQGVDYDSGMERDGSLMWVMGLQNATVPVKVPRPRKPVVEDKLEPIPVCARKSHTIHLSMGPGVRWPGSAILADWLTLCERKVPGTPWIGQPGKHCKKCAEMLTELT